MSDQFPPPPPPPGYGAAPVPPAHPTPRTSSNAVVALVLAICSFIICPLIPAVVALFLAASAQREINASGGWVTGSGLVQGAKIASWINIGLCIAVILGFLLIIVTASVSSTTS
jgi:hypothetical protein